MNAENYGNMKCGPLQFGSDTPNFQKNVLLPFPMSKMQTAL